MKQLPVLTLILVLLSATSIYAQSIDKTVESINKRYAEIAEKARLCETDDEQGEFGELVMDTLTINTRGHQWRAVGRYQPTYKFFYKDGDDGIRMYPDQLVMVKVEQKISNRVTSEEYIYSATGLLLYYVYKAEPADPDAAERRIYFSGVKAIRIVEDGKTRDRLTNKYANAVRDLHGQNRKIKDLFLRSLRL